MFPLRPLAGEWAAHLHDDSCPMKQGNPRDSSLCSVSRPPCTISLSLSLFFPTSLRLFYICNTSLFSSSFPSRDGLALLLFVLLFISQLLLVKTQHTDLHRLGRLAKAAGIGDWDSDGSAH